jgi:hypothetical protein
MGDRERKMGAPPPQSGQEYQMQQQPDYGYSQNNGGQQQWQQPNYGYQQNNGYPPPNQQQYEPPKQSYPPPNAGYQPQPDGPPPSYDQTFKIEKPRYNDLWAGILVSRMLRERARR